MISGHEKAEWILSVLPGVDCGGMGGCGMSDCQACAEAIAAGASPALCPACGQETVDAIAEALGVETAKAKDEIAFVACAGNAAGKARFAGCGSCEEAVQMGFSRGECHDGCVGCGSCVSVCKFGAMKMVDGDVIIDEALCTGCGACADPRACVQGIIRMIPKDATNFIPCSNTMEDDEEVRKSCGFGCIACSDCVRAGP